MHACWCEMTTSLITWSNWALHLERCYLAGFATGRWQVMTCPNQCISRETCFNSGNNNGYSAVLRSRLQLNVDDCILLGLRASTFVCVCRPLPISGWVVASKSRWLPVSASKAWSKAKRFSCVGIMKYYAYPGQNWSSYELLWFYYLQIDLCNAFRKWGTVPQLQTSVLGLVVSQVVIGCLSHSVDSHSRKPSKHRQLLRHNRSSIAHCEIQNSTKSASIYRIEVQACPKHFLLSYAMVL